MLRLVKGAQTANSLKGLVTIAWTKKERQPERPKVNEIRGREAGERY
jgi:hypothetical protein